MSTDSFQALKKHLLQRATEALGLEGDMAARLRLGDPPDPERGDVSLACHAVAGALKDKPPAVAERLAAALAQGPEVAAAQADQGFCNVTFDRAALLGAALSGEVLPTDPQATASYLIEFSGPNTNKPLHIGHLRNTILGAAMSEIARRHGHPVTRYNIVNDRGIHICKSMVAYQRFAQGETPADTGEKGDQFVGRYYSRFARAATEEFQAWSAGAGATALQEYLVQERQRVANAADQELRKRYLASVDPTTLDFKPKKVKAREYLARMTATPALEEAYQAWRGDRTAEESEIHRAEGLKLAQGAMARRFEQEASELHAESRDTLRRWEEGDPEVRALWSRMNAWVMDGLQRTYDRLGVVFDHVDFESDTYLLGKKIVEDLLARGIARLREDGAAVFDLPAKKKGQPPQEKIILRADGTSVYITQDLGTLVRRHERHHPDWLVYVVGSEQELHFETLFTLVDRYLPGLGQRCVHLSYGMVELPHGKMKSREGDIIEADSFLDEVHQAAEEQIRSRAPDLDPEEVERRAETIAMAAVKYHLLKYSKRSTVKFDVETALDLNGKTGTYCLYALARIRSILRRLEADQVAVEPARPENAASLAPEEVELLKLVLRLPESFGQAVQDLEPYHVAEAVYRMARSFNGWYTATDETGGIRFPVLQCPDLLLRSLRVSLIQQVETSLEAGLASLGISTLREM